MTELREHGYMMTVTPFVGQPGIPATKVQAVMKEWRVKIKPTVGNMFPQVVASLLGGEALIERQKIIIAFSLTGTDT